MFNLTRLVHRLLLSIHYEYIVTDTKDNEGEENRQESKET